MGRQMEASKLFTPFTIGALRLNNRVVMAPMTRSRASQDHVASELAIEYYQQRASAGLIITEGTAPSPNGEGYPRTPGLYTAKQIAAWKKITDAVHQKGAKIFVQLMHVGRIAHPLNKALDAKTVAPSAIKANGTMFTDEQGMVDLTTPRAIALEEIPSIIEEFRQATVNAFEAGFDGVELHAANGYLPMQFISSNTNQRTDHYGGSAESDIRFVIEVLQAMVGVEGSDKIGIRLSPGSSFNDIDDANPTETYTTLLKALTPLQLAYLHVVGSPMQLPHKPDLNEVNELDVYEMVQDYYTGTVIGNSGFNAETAERAIVAGKVDLISFGSCYIANPDLVERMKQAGPFNQPNPETFYSPGATGYTDYSFLE